MKPGRPPKSADEIAALPASGTTECGAHVRERVGTYSPETLVHIIRRARLAGDTTTTELCFRALLGREGSDCRWIGGFCEGTIVKLARSYGFDEGTDLFRDFRAQCYLELSRGIFGDGVFWEHRFGMAFRQRCIDAAIVISRPAVGNAEEDSNSTALDAEPEAEAAKVVSPGPSVADVVAGGDQHAQLRAAIRRLPPRQAEAAFLAWDDELPIEGKQHGTVAGVMGITPTAVRKLLKKAGATLRSDPTVRTIRFGEA